jgi:hypothetical protein
MPITPDPANLVNRIAPFASPLPAEALSHINVYT